MLTRKETILWAIGRVSLRWCDVASDEHANWHDVVVIGDGNDSVDDSFLL